MDFIKIRFGNDFGKMRPDFDKAEEDVFRSVSPMFRLSEFSWKPQMDIYETREEILVIAEMAGVEKDDFSVEINRKAIKIAGERAEPPRDENGTYRLAEIRYGKFERILFLPSPIDTDKVNASYVNGLLLIRVVKLPKNIAKKIPITD